MAEAENIKTVLVTGASRGIGRAIALTFARQGMNIAAVSTRQSEDSDETLRLVKECGAQCEFFPCDVSDFAAAGETVKAVTERFGGVDILVNNAGITRDGLLMQMSEESFDRVIAVNLKGAFNMTKAVIRDMARKRSGCIINISSVAGLMGNVGQTNYASAKAGLIGFTKSVAREYAARGIRCNAVCPGYIATDMTGAMNDAAREKIMAMIPVGRAGEPEDVAGAVAFAAQAPYITGEVIRVDGGMYI